MPAEGLVSDSERSDLLTYHYAYTIDIHPLKWIRNVGVWKCLSTVKQRLILNDVIKSAFKHCFNSNDYDDYKFEFTKNGNVHVHGSFIATVDKAHNFQNYMFIAFGMPKSKKHRVCFITATEVDRKFWDDYKTKDQLDIPMFDFPN